MVTAAFKRVPSFHQQNGLKFKEAASEVLHLEHGLCVAETCTVRKVDRMFYVCHVRALKGVIHFTLKQQIHIYKCVQSHYYSSAKCFGTLVTIIRVSYTIDQKYRESFEMLCWRKTEKISCTDRVRNEVLQRVKEGRIILRTINRRNTDWIGDILRRNCLLKSVIEGKLEERIKVTERRARRRKQLLDNPKETSGYWKLKEEVLDRSLWGTRLEVAMDLSYDRLQNDE